MLILNLERAVHFKISLFMTYEDKRNLIWSGLNSYG